MRSGLFDSSLSGLGYDRYSVERVKVNALLLLV